MEDQFIKLAGMMSKMAWELHDKEYIDEGLKEMLLDFWREFNDYEQRMKDLN